MSTMIHFGVTPENVHNVYENIRGVRTDLDSWHVWGEDYNTWPSVTGVDAVHFTIPVTDENTLRTLVTDLYNANIPLVEMRDVTGALIGDLIVRTDADDWAEDVSSWHKDGLANYHYIHVLTSDANYFDPDTLDPITAEWLDEHVHDQGVMDAALADREILSRKEALSLAKNMDMAGPFSQ